MTTTSRTKAQAGDPIPAPEQESILLVLALDTRGSELAARLKPKHFDVPYDAVAERLLEYWRQYNEPPGKGHLVDLFAEDVGKEKKPRLKRTIVNLLKLAEEPLNPQFVIDQLGIFLRKQKLKAAILEAGQRYEQGGPALVADVERILCDALGDAALPRSTIETTNLRDVEAKRTEWLWQDRIPRGQHITTTGLPFVGKSLLMLSFAAQYSRGRPNPDGTPAPRGRVLLLAQEDSVATTLKPRLKALGADMASIDILDWVRTEKGTERSFLLSEDLAELERLIRERPDTLMVGIDPITAYIGGKLDSHKTTDVRSVLEPLNKLAERTGALVFSITHPAKSSQSAINAFVGSQAFIAVPRMGYLVAAEEQDGKETGRVLLACVGSNIGERPTTLAYRKETVWVAPDKDADPKETWRRYQKYLANEPDANRGRRRWLQLQAELETGDIRAPMVVWDEVDGLDISAQEIIGGASARGDAMASAIAFLRTYLRDGPRDSKEVEETAAQLGINRATFLRAKKQVCRSYRVGLLGKDGHWMSELKETGKQEGETG